MIGVIANPSDECVVREFFELFKTPWEFFRENGRYDVVVCAGDSRVPSVSTRLLIVYGGADTFLDGVQVPITSRSHSGNVSFVGNTLPIYGPVLSFAPYGTAVLEHCGREEPAGYVVRSGESWVARIGYDLFSEVQALLTDGQPSVNASIPALELHVALLRSLITGCGLPLIEIPPVPAGYSFIACLTHDVDHASIRRHKFDATMLGFLYRATVASAVNTARGRMSLRRLMLNWAASVKLPFVYLGLAEDFWYGFDRYLDLEAGRPSTFYLIPFAGRPGEGRPEGAITGRAPAARGAGYNLSDIATKIRRLADAGCEIGLHGIDAWNDKTKGREEARRISEVSGARTTGVRMHWLYSDRESPAVLDEADFAYDSTVGYNETVGYRAGTAQVFKPLRANRLLELPLHVMDTALFYPDYMGLTEDEASSLLTTFLNNGVRFGGVLTVNWHDRSIAPERLWDSFYIRLLNELTEKGALFCTAAQAVSWFQMRRSATFEKSGVDGEVCVKVSTVPDKRVPALRVRFHQPAASRVFSEKSEIPGVSYIDTALDERMEFRFQTC